MMIGYCASKDIESIVTLKNYGCDTVELYEPTGNLKEQFEHFLEKNKESSLVVTDFESLNLPLIQCRNGFELIKMINIDFRFLDKEISINLLINLIKNESRIRKIRTKKGLECAKSQGKIAGRPKIATELAERIAFLYKKHNMTFRQIAEECQVSLGTAYKYCKDC